MALPANIFRLSRAQFLPVILSPVLVGSVLARWSDHLFNFVTFGLVVLGSIAVHLASNIIDDAYDYESGVDVVSNEMFPPDFGGWKPLPRGLMTFDQAKLVGYFFFGMAALVGVYLTILAGPLVLILGAIGVFFAYFHVAPPLRLGYRGLGLSEFGIFLSFGVLPVAGSFYVQSGHISPLSLLVGVPLGLLTASVLMNHDQIFFDPYVKSGKKSFTVAVGRAHAIVSAIILTLISFMIIIGAVLARLAPISSLLVLLTLPLFVVQLRLYRAHARSPLHYVKLTQTTMALSVIFGVLLAVGLLLA